MFDNDVESIEYGLKAFEEATESTITTWQIDNTTNTITFEFSPPPPIEHTPFEDVLSSIKQSEEWFANRKDPDG